MVRLADGNERSIKFIATTTYWGPDGRPISAAEFLERLFGDLSEIISDEDQLREVWSDPSNREHFSDHGYDQDRLEDIRQLVDAPKSDLFDVLAYVLFTHDPKTRRDRAEGVRDEGLSDFNGELKELLLSILEAYEEDGEGELATKKLGRFMTARYGSVNEGKTVLGKLSGVREAYLSLQRRLYSS